MITGLILSGVVGVALQLPPPSAATRPPGPREKADAPFSGLFDPSKQPGENPKDLKFEVRRTPGPRTKIVCGTTLIIVGSEIDPEMAKPTPNEGTRFTMRRYPPPACGKDEERREPNGRKEKDKD